MVFQNFQELSGRITLVNHASVLIEYCGVGVLSDPWYSGSAFHNGWSLLHETPEDDQIHVINRTTHIWISHEHPDHFSIGFFKKHEKLIKSRGIKILFQETNDKRVESFFIRFGFDLIVMKDLAWVDIGPGFSVKVIKSRFYDSALFLSVGNTIIANLNDYPIREKRELASFVRQNGEADILLTQFSYAAWKGGKDNSSWRRAAARDKCSCILNQANALNVKVVIPFASFISFSNSRNAYMNDCSNRPDVIVNECSSSRYILAFLRPMDTKLFSQISFDRDAVDFWQRRFDSISNASNLFYSDSRTFADLDACFHTYCKNLFSRNSRLLMRILSIVSPVKCFQPVFIYLDDLDKCVSIDIFAKKLSLVACDHSDLSMHSDSLYFILRHEFGFDTLMVNGCFEQVDENGFSRSAKTLGISNLNSIGIYINLGLVKDLRALRFFVLKLFQITRYIQ